MATPIASYLEQGAKSAELRKQERMRVIDTSMETIKGNLANVQAVLIGYSMKESSLRKCLEVAEQSAEQGDTEAILRCLDAMREILGMKRVQTEMEEWTVDEILANAG